MSAQNSPPAAPSFTRLLSPRSIAIVGASEKPGRIGTRVLDNVMRKFAGEILPVNPRAETLRGLPVYPDIASLAEGVDMAIVVVPADFAVPAIDELAQRGVGGVTLLTSGFSETGAEGAARQAELVEVIQRTGIKLLGTPTREA